MVILSLDVGMERIGVAQSDDTATLASPRGVIRRRSTSQALDAIARAVAEARAELVVVGLPLSLDGSVGPQARSVRAFADRLRRRLAVAVVLWDERYSTLEAEESLRAAGVRPTRMRGRLDAAAAAVILQNYLDRPRGTSAPPRPSPGDSSPADRSAGIGGPANIAATGPGGEGSQASPGV